MQRITSAVSLRIEERFRWSAHRSSRSSCKTGALPTELRPRVYLSKCRSTVQHTALAAHNLQRCARRGHARPVRQRATRARLPHKWRRMVDVFSCPDQTHNPRVRGSSPRGPTTITLQARSADAGELVEGRPGNRRRNRVALRLEEPKRLVSRLRRLEGTVREAQHLREVERRFGLRVQVIRSSD
jgi:hypothetical protein